MSAVRNSHFDARINPIREISKSLRHKSKTVKIYEFFSSIGIAISFSLSFGQSPQTKQVFSLHHPIVPTTPLI
jgi:hypothetical protein